MTAEIFRSADSGVLSVACFEAAELLKWAAANEFNRI